MEAYEPLLSATRISNDRAWRIAGDTKARFGNAPGTPWAEGFQAGWHRSGMDVEVYSDRFGLVPLYYCSTATRFGVAASWVILQREFGFSELDHDALSCYFYAGLYAGEDTPFVQIRRMPPDSVLRWSEGALTVQRRSSWPPGLSSLSLDEAIDQYVIRMNDVMRSYSEAAPPGAIVPLSGGQDSRHILLALLATGRSTVRAVTQQLPPPLSDEDAQVASLICQRAGVPHVVVPPGVRTIELEREKNVLLGLDSIHHAWLLPMRRWMDANGVPAFYDGFVGDVLSGSKYLTETRIDAWRRGDPTSFAQDFCWRHSYVGRLAQPEYSRLWTRERAIARIEREARRFIGLPNPHNHFGLARARRVIAPALWPLLGEGREVMLPYLDPQVFELLIDLPMEYSMNRTLHREAIRRGYPEFASLPYETATTKQRPESSATRSRLLIDSLRIATPTGRRPVSRRPALLTYWAKSLAHLGSYDYTMRWIPTALYLTQIEELLAG